MNQPLHQPMNVLAVIPARFASSRFPGKPLVPIAGVSLIERVYRRVCQARLVDHLLVATDDQRILDHVHGFGGNGVMTRPDHPSGSDRIAEAAKQYGQADVVVNVQGDEPLVEPALIDAMIAAVLPGTFGCATPVAPITSPHDLLNPNVVKVAMRDDGVPLYFSRSPIPHCRGKKPEEWLAEGAWFRHIGLYAYRAEALQQFVAAPPAMLEQIEQLEQLRMIALGIPMICVKTNYASIGVDTPEDLSAVEQALANLERSAD